jgi:P4 family phage/plasmid primase-like protien
MNFYKKKKECIDSLPDGHIIANKEIIKYFHITSHQAFLDLVQSTHDPCYFEYISDTQIVKLFFDIEIYQNQDFYDTPLDAVDIISNVYGLNFILLESHSTKKKSFHIIYPDIYYLNVKELKNEIIQQVSFKKYINDKIIDISVYRSGLFRTVLSSKKNEKRPLIISSYSPLKGPLLDTFVTFGDFPVFQQNGISFLFTFLESLVTTPLVTTPLVTTTTTTAKQTTVIQQFVRGNYNYKPSDISNIILNRENKNIIIALKDRFCGNINREHKSNHQYIVVDLKSSKQKCHDPDCKIFQKNEISIPKDSAILDILSFDSRKNILPYTPKMLQDGKNDGKVLMDSMWKDKDANFDYDKKLEIFHSKAAGGIVDHIFLNGGCKGGCKPQHCIASEGFYIKCTECNTSLPAEIFPTPKKYSGLRQFFITVNNTNINSHNNNTDSHNITNNNRNYVSADNVEDFNCQVDIDPTIFNDPVKTEMFNQILSGHKVVKMSELLSTLEKDFVYCAQKWWMFKNSIWKIDTEAIDLHYKNTLLSLQLDIIVKFYKDKSSGADILSNVTKLIEKIYRWAFQSEIINGAKYYYKDDTFLSKLDSQKFLVPFYNGVYDLLAKKFRPTLKEDYISMTLGYNYNPDVCNQDVYSFINCILPDAQIRAYVLKKMAECLNADIPNTHFLMFVGNGANGKSQLLNLMKLALGDFGVKLDVTLLTRKRSDSTTADPEKMKLRNKRFAFLSEPEDGESFNISQLKEMTGSEELVARGLYMDSVTFQMEAKLFLGCNELPKLKGEDTALWRRIRVVDFKSKFVENPKEENEYIIDTSLPSRMKSDITWRQTFLNILLDYYYKAVPEPKEVTVKTQEYAQDNNEYASWFEEHVIEKEDGVLQLQDIARNFHGHENVSQVFKTKLKNALVLYLKTKNIDSLFKRRRLNDVNKHCWVGIDLI